MKYHGALIASDVVRVALAIPLGYLLAFVLGYEHDVRGRLVKSLRARERELEQARTQLSGRVEEKHADLARAQSELSDARYELEQAITHAPVGIVTVNAERALRYVNNAALRYLGLAGLPDGIAGWDALINQVEVYGPGNRRLLPGDGPVTDALRHGRRQENVEFRVVGQDGETRWLSGYIGPLLNADGDIVGAVIMLLDTTTHKDAVRALQRLTGLLFRVQEQERGALARELHDEIGQSLSALKFRLHTESSDAALPLDASMAQLDDLTSTIRQLSLELRPSALDDFGLTSALGTYLGELQAQHQVPCRLDVDTGLQPPGEEIATVAYRTVQQAVQNALRHSQASAITVRLSSAAGKLLLEIADDGAGFDVEATEIKAASEGRLGLLFMRERVRQVGGRLVIESSPGHGTRVKAELPAQHGA